MVGDLAVRIHKKGKMLGLTSYDPNIPWLEITALVCTSCGRLECFATNGAELQQIAGAQLVRAAGGT